MNERTQTLHGLKRSDVFKKNVGWLKRYWPISVFLAVLIFGFQMSAQTLQFAFPFNDSGTAMTSSGGPISVTLGMVYSNNAANNAFPKGSYLPVDLHDGPNTFLGGGQALNFTKVAASAVASPSPNAVAYTTNNPNLGLGAVSQCTVSFWFKTLTGNSGVGRFFFLGTNGIIDSTAGAQYSSIGIQQQNLGQVQVEMNQNGTTLGAQNITFSPLVNGEIPIGQWEFMTLVYDTSISNGVYNLYTGDYAHAPTLVASNVLVNKGPLQLGTVGTLIMGNNLAFTRPYPGKLANFQFYTGAANSTFVSNLWAVTVPVPFITATPHAGADIGSNAVLTVNIPAAYTASSNYVVAITSDNTSVVANTNITFPHFVNSQSIGLPILAQGNAKITISGPGLGNAVSEVAGLNESGLINQWLADDYATGQSWTDRVSQVVATINASSLATAVPSAFGAHAGLVESNYTFTGANNNTAAGTGFLIPPGTAFGGAANTFGLTNWTVAVVFKPFAAGATGGGYYNASQILGWDIGGSGQQDWGVAWGNNDGPQAGLQVEAGAGGNGSGDAGLFEPAGAPNTGLNRTHCAVLQVDGTTSRDTLYVDGMLVSSAYLAAYAINTNNTFPILQRTYATSPGVLPGYVAEIRFYSNSLVNAGGLSAYLQNNYASVLPITVAVAPNAAQIGSNVTVTVTIPSFASASGSFPVTIVSDTAGVVGNTNITFPIGVTVTNVSIPVVGAGTANLTVSGAGLGDGLVSVIGLAPRTMIEQFLASSLPTQLPGINDNDSISQWIGESNSATAYPGNVPPTYKANATLAGTPSVQFASASQENMGVPSGNNPINNQTNFSVVVVYRANSAGAASGTAWYNMAGFADAEIGGNTFDWGMELDVNGYPNFGTGSPTTVNGDANDSLAATNYSTVDSLFHVAVGSFDVLNGVKQITLDNNATITESSATQHFLAGNNPRLPAALTFGENKYGSYLNGEIAEIRFYSGALLPSEASNIVAQLHSTYNLIWPNQSLITVTPLPTAAEIGQSGTLNIAIPSGFNNSSSISVTVTSSVPGAVTFDGLPSANLVFAAGTTNLKTVSLQFASVGVATITAAGSGLIAGNANVSVLPVPTAQEIFRASDLTNQIPGIANGDLVQTWVGSVNSTIANASSVAPVFNAAATPSGGPSVQFLATSNAYFDIQPSSDPAAGLTNFSVAAVFRASAPANTGFGNWWDMAGLLDDEESGFPADWGLEVDVSGNVIFGTGSGNGSVTVPNYSTVGSAFHVVVASYDSVNGVETIQVDNQPQVSQVGLLGSPRIAGTLPLRIGQNQYGDFFNGDIVELRIYNGALSSSEMNAAISQLSTNYNLAFPGGGLTSVSLNISSLPPSSLNISWSAAATTSGYVLESSTNLLSGWSATGLTVGNSGTNSVVTDSVTNGTRYYRLHHP
jgi:hypothetical protein